MARLATPHTGVLSAGIQLIGVLALVLVRPAAAADPAPIFNRAPLAEKPYAELPLGAIRPEGWLRNELQRMASGMTGHLDEWCPEICGPRNAWLGGDGDSWERGPYWIDGLYPLAKLLEDKLLQEKAMKWVEWTLAHQRNDGQIGPQPIVNKDRQQPPPAGAQIDMPDDWWPRMVMLKILQQHYLATGDSRVIACLTKYFRYQLGELPKRPLHDPNNPASGSWWAAQRGGDNLMVVLWLYNVTGDEFLLELADLIYKQTVPVTDWLGPGPLGKVARRGDRRDVRGGPAMDPFHCVNLAQMLKTPVLRWQQDRDQRHLDAVATGLADIKMFHGQPTGLYGADELMHGDAPDRGSELCTAVEMMFCLEKMFEITGDALHADRLERVAFNALPTQCTDDHRGRQYFQQTSQVQCTFGDRDFFNDDGDRVVFGLTSGYSCCTCNLHQGWPKFTQHLWLASKDGGVALVSYVPSTVTTKVADGRAVRLQVAGGYPFDEQTTITVTTESPVKFPLHLRIPAWAEGAELHINNQPQPTPRAGVMHIIDRQWNHADRLTIRLPMHLRTSDWHAHAKAIERGPLVFALDIQEQWRHVERPRPAGIPDSAPGFGYREVRPASPWNYALTAAVIEKPQENTRVELSDKLPLNPWTREAAPIKIHAKGVRLPYWNIDRNSATPPPLSPAELPPDAKPEDITLIPYGATTLRIAEFPWVRLP